MKQALFMLLLLSPFLSGASRYVGRDLCRPCHQKEDRLWQNSPHELAMQEARQETVLGNFDNVRYTWNGQTSRFFRKRQEFWVNTQGADGQPGDYRIQYCFGVYPLQQYLIGFPGGKLQVLDIAWDSRPEAEGGQRWFHLHPDTPTPPGDVLHWTGPNLNWNYMCADCHSTNLKKNYDSSTRNYKTTWASMDVSCEACHGPGSDHVAWARSEKAGQATDNKGLTAVLDERKDIQWLRNAISGRPQRSLPNTQRRELDICAHCHARREQLTDEFVPGQDFMDAYRPVLIEQGLYHADGQMEDEVYVWGSFLQSKMYQAGVTCSDCHDPHSTRLRAPGSEICEQCHEAKRYATPTHHHHEPGSSGADCLACHMPAKNYMKIDLRHDHGFRIPSPSLTQQTGAPNPCNQCHNDKDTDWAVAQTRSWYGHPPQGFQKFAQALAAARRNDPSAAALLRRLIQDPAQPGIARATALGHLGGSIDPAALSLIRQNLQSQDPLLRMGALNALQTSPQNLRQLALPLLADRKKAIRIQAARLLAGYDRKQLNPTQRKMLEDGLREFIQAQEFNSERPESQVNLGSLYADLNEPGKAEAAFRTALQLQARFTPAREQLSALLEQQGRKQEAQALLLEGLQEMPESAALHYALGLFLVRNHKLKEALLFLKNAEHLAPDNSTYAYALAIALHSDGRLHQALKVLERAHKAHPRDITLLSTLVSFNQQSGNKEAATQWSRKLQALNPD